MALLAAVTFSISACSKDDKPKPSKDDSTFTELFPQRRMTASLQALNAEGQPLADAQILIGLAQGTPFEGNYGITDENGEFQLPSDWTAPEMVTIDAPGYLRATYMALLPESRTFILKKKFEAQKELKGKTSGHPVRHKDGYIDYSLVMSAMTRQDLLNFQLHKVLSPTDDVISIMGQEIRLPSNVSLPKQTENYFIGITIEKPAYSLAFSTGGVQRVFAARGRFLFKPVVDGFRDDAELFELINHFNITGGSIRDVNLVENITKLDIPVMDITFKDKKEFQAPALEKGEVLIVLPVADSQGYLIPTDIKRLTSKQKIKLAVWNEHPTYVAQVLKRASEFHASKPGMDRLSASLLPLDIETQPGLLPLISSPRVHNQFVYQIPDMTSESIHPLVTYAVLSDVKTSKNSMGEIKKTPHQTWEVYAPHWVTEITLPNWEWSKVAPLTRFEVSLVGSINQESVHLGPELMEKATHVTRSSSDF